MSFCSLVKGFIGRMPSAVVATFALMCDEHGLVRSMSRKGCSPDNARCESLCA